MEKLKQKLMSRKFWLSLIPIIVGIAELMGADADSVQLVCGGLLTVIPAVFYVITEGRIDAAQKAELKKLDGKDE